jgi:FkbM family methyltransferase
MGSTRNNRRREFWQAFSSFLQFRKYFKNSKEVWTAYRVRSPLPTLVLKSGLTLQHDLADEPLRLFREFFVERGYTSKRFYMPRCGDVVVDLGGRVGFFALSIEWMARGVRIHTFEPSTDRRIRLKRNVTSNRLNPFITIYPFIVGVAASPQLQTAGQAGLRSLEGRPNSSFSMLEVLPTLSLTEAIDLTGAGSVDLLKIDSEGNELAILEGADAETWAKIHRVVVKYYEIHDFESIARIKEILNSQGFESLEILPDRKQPGVGLIRAARLH